MITIIARIQVRPEQADEAMPIFEKLVQASRLEPGCVQYDLHRGKDNSGLFFFYERWKEDALDTHNGSAHLAAFREAIAPFLLAPVEVHRLDAPEFTIVQN